MGSRRIITVADLLREGFWLRVSCRCGHSVAVDPVTLVNRGVVRLADLNGRLKCSACGSREVTHGHCFAPNCVDI